MKQKLLMLLGIILVMFCFGCDNNTVDENQMPDIVFKYFRDNCDMEKENDIWIIDKDGKVYNNIRDEYMDIYTIQEEYQEIQTNGKWRFVKQIEVEEVKSQYDILKDVFMGDKNIVNRGETVVDEYRGTKEWVGYCLDKKGNNTYVELHQEGDLFYTNEDIRAKELADWMSGVIGLEEIDNVDEDEDDVE